ncbi:hypothetical protein [Chryseobacterium sp. JAH]|uniref:hypothetical protein n=1 Tax=Chryseobacterium sp. JAH TaxID=1742858 RepID=UPI0007412157|nr:hypothetical protein [Chryseobacterium sp. JAH]KUJ53296.1 hypothetical protein AR685_02595 [Chryseobacterium sp. JAH]
MKRISILFLIFSTFLYSQKIQIVDAENSQPIANARIVLSDQLMYTNEDGFAPLDGNSKDFEVSASGFHKEKLNTFQNVVRLKPYVKDIEEVKIIDIDIKNLFEDLYKNYHKRYYDEPSLYDVTFKSKGFNNDKLFFMVIAEAKLWSKSNAYNFKYGYRKDYDEMLQMQLNNVKFYKKNESESIFNIKTKDVSHDEIGNYFFSYEIYRMLLNMRMKNSKNVGRLLSEDVDLQLIGIKIKSENGIEIEGEITYDKKDKVITLYNLNYMQGGYPVYKKVNTDGKEFEYQLGNANVTFDFYKKEGKYIQALKKTSGEQFFIIHDGKKDERKFSTEIIYNTFAKSDKKGLISKVDFTKNIWENIPVKEDKESTILLSKEEQEFINQK